MSSDQATGGEPPIDPLLGQPRMVNDPRISVAQAAEVLGKKRAQVERMIKLGRLPRRGAPNTSRGRLLSDVLRVRDKGEPMKLGQVAQWLQRSTDAVRQLIAEGKLPLVPGSERLVYPSDVRALSAASPAPPRNPPPATGPDGYINTRAAAQRLDLSPSQTRQLAADGRLPATRDDQGRWWFNPDHIDMVRRARQANAKAKLWRGDEPTPLRRASGVQVTPDLPPDVSSRRPMRPPRAMARAMKSRLLGRENAPGGGSSDSADA